MDVKELKEAIKAKKAVQREAVKAVKAAEKALKIEQKSLDKLTAEIAKLESKLPQ